MKKSRYKFLLLLIPLIALIYLTYPYLLRIIDMDTYGRTYKSREQMCTDFAHSYLGYIKNVDSSSELWDRVINIETDIHNLCMLNPENDENLKQYTSTVQKKYNTK